MHQIGCPVEELDTPALCIDLDAFEANIAKMAALCREHGIQWRPHAKAHKSPQIAQKLVEAGAIGVTCAKLSEAEVMAVGGIRDILVANQIAGPAKMRRLANVARQCDLIVTIDHADQVGPISRAMADAGLNVRAIIEVDIGLHRAGVAPEHAVELGKLVDAAPGITLAGIMGYEGHLLTLTDLDEKERKIREALGLLVEVRDRYVEAGLPCPIVSAGGTGSYSITMRCPGITELQAGGLIFMDAFYRYRCHVTEFQHALKLYVTVVSRPTPNRAIVDAGRKAHFVDHQPSFVVGYEDSARFTRLSAEHGELELDEPARGLKIGDRLELVPGYSDMTNVLHNEFYGIRNGQVEVIWPLVGRGRLQ
jgi:D-serine deaminase-like pyridoxal phosphate-dependent protein